MFIEVKQVMPANFQQINSHHTIELLLYCNYLMNLKNLENKDRGLHVKVYQKFSSIAKNGYYTTTN